MHVPPGWRPRILAALAAAALLVALGLARLPSLARDAVTRAAEKRGLIASFERFRLGWGPTAHFTRLALARVAGGDTVATAESLEVRIAWRSLLTGRPAPAAIRLAHARLEAGRARTADPDTLAPDRADAGARGRGATAARVREAGEQLVRLLLVPARTLPALDLTDVTVRRAGEDEESRTLHLDRLRLHAERGSVRLDASGALAGEDLVPFAGEITYAHDDRLTGRARFDMREDASGRVRPLELAIDGRIRQDRRRGRLEVVAPTRLTIGEIGIAIDGRFERAGPALHLALAADSLSGARLARSLPAPVLGPLCDVGTIGSWDYRLRLDLDCARPDSVDFAADVIPHGLRLDPARTRLGLLALDQPFVAEIHLPHHRIVERDLSSANPHFRTLDRIDPRLAYGVVTNEDGAFFRHRGFNAESVREAIAENLRAGAFRRGAGTITMQLARNLWLGHERTLSRKAQEVMLAWALEHLTGLSKERLLEIYLNIIEWGPEVHGADEAARYYFGHDAGRLTIDEALFLTIVVPSPTHWYWRFDRSGELRSFARAQMHFIGRAMIAKGWLDPAELPPADQLRVDLRGPAGERFREGAAPGEIESLGAR